MPGRDFSNETLTGSVIGAAFEVFRNLKFGLFESLYARALSRELLDRGHDVAREIVVPIFYKGRELGLQRLDMLVDRPLIVEVKSTRALHPVAARQLYSHICSTRIELGLLLHFGPDGAGIRRMSAPNVDPQNPLDPQIPLSLFAVLRARPHTPGSLAPSRRSQRTFQA